MPDIAIYGLGEMGAEIARCLVSRGTTLAAHDPLAAPDINGEGFRPGASVPEVATTAQVHLVVVRRQSDLEALLLRDDGVCANAPADSLIVLHTTVLPQVVAALRDEVTTRGHVLVDAALSRRDGRISEGSLSLLVGGMDADLARARTTLESYADNVVFMGPPGAGMTAKLCNNWLLYANRHAALQALSVGREMGLDVDVLRGALASSTGSSWALAHYSDLDAAILDGRGAPPDVRERTGSELGMVHEMVSAIGTVPTTLAETLTLVEAMREPELSDPGRSS